MHVIENVARKMDMRENKETRLENTNKSIQIQSQSINIQQNLERSNDVHCMVRDCMANPRGSVVDTALLMGKVGSPITVPVLKNTSGLVQAATARRIWVVRKDSPTWYAARMIISTEPLYCRLWYLTVHPAKPFSRDKLEIDPLISIFSINEMG